MEGETDTDIKGAGYRDKERAGVFGDSSVVLLGLSISHTLFEFSVSIFRLIIERQCVRRLSGCSKRVFGSVVPRSLFPSTCCPRHVCPSVLGTAVLATAVHVASNSIAGNPLFPTPPFFHSACLPTKTKRRIHVERIVSWSSERSLPPKTYRNTSMPTAARTKHLPTSVSLFALYTR